MSYFSHELGKLTPTAEQPNYTLKVVAAIGETRWLSIDPETFKEVEALLLAKEKSQALNPRAT